MARKPRLPTRSGMPRSWALRFVFFAGSGWPPSGPARLPQLTAARMSLALVSQHRRAPAHGPLSHLIWALSGVPASARANAESEVLRAGLCGPAPPCTASSMTEAAVASPVASEKGRVSLACAAHAPAGWSPVSDCRLDCRLDLLLVPRCGCCALAGWCVTCKAPAPALTPQQPRDGVVQQVAGESAPDWLQSALRWKFCENARYL